jgi:hypothetical protein
VRLDAAAPETQGAAHVLAEAAAEGEVAAGAELVVADAGVETAPEEIVAGEPIDGLRIDAEIEGGLLRREERVVEGDLKPLR